MNGLILGRSLYGKTSAAKILGRAFRASGRRVIALDIIGDDWGDSVDWQTDDPDEFDRVFWGSYDVIAFVDEGGEVAGRKNERMKWTATRGRHQVGEAGFGNSVYYLAHRLNVLDPTLRAQCPELFLFASAFDDAKDLSNEYGAPELRNAPSLNVGEFYHVSPGKGCTKHKISEDRLTFLSMENNTNLDE